MTDSSHASPGLVRTMAIAGGATVANLYYCQPLLVEMGRDVGASARALGVVPTLTQVGYAVGLLLVVPLGDKLERRRVILAMTALVTLALLAVMASPNLAWLGAASLAVGATTVVPQLLIPFAATLARPEDRARTVAQVTGGILVGVLLSRTLGGTVAAHLGWRAVFGVAAAMMVALGIALRLSLPRQEPRGPSLRYPALLSSLWHLVRDEKVLRLHALLGALTFGAFSAFWTTLAPFLERTHHKGPATVGLYGAVGVLGALAAPLVGRRLDRQRDRRVNAIAIVCVLVSFPIFWVSRGSLWGLAVGVVLMDLGVQANHVSNQAWIFSLRADAHSRVNTVYMVAYFVGGALGALASSVAYDAWGWGGSCAVGTALAGAALVRLLWAGKTARPVSAGPADEPDARLVSG